MITKNTSVFHPINWDKFISNCKAANSKTPINSTLEEVLAWLPEFYYDERNNFFTTEVHQYCYVGYKNTGVQASGKSFEEALERCLLLFGLYVYCPASALDYDPVFN